MESETAQLWTSYTWTSKKAFDSVSHNALLSKLQALGIAGNFTTEHYTTELLFTTEHYNHITPKAYKTLGLLRRTFKSNNTQTKKLLYISLVRSQLTYCSQLWRPHLIKDITLLERIQRRATKYVHNNLSYKSRLEQLHLLPLMYIYELNDLLFRIKSLKFPTSHFDISKYIQFSNYGTRATFAHKLNHPISLISTTYQHSFHNRIIRLWNSTPVIDLSLSIDIIKKHLINFLWTQFTANFTSDHPCSFHFVCPCYQCSKIPVVM